MSEFKLSIDRNPGAGEGTKLSSAKAATAEVAEQVRKRRAAIHKQHKEDAAAEAPPAAPAAPPPPREDIDSIEIPLRDGTIIEYGPPRGVSLTDRISRFYGDRDPTAFQSKLTRILMCVRAIDGKPVSFTDEVGQTKLANRIGDEGLDLLFHFDNQLWPPLRRAELPAIKKNLRT